MKKNQEKVTASPIRELRQARGLPAAELAAQCGIRRQTVYAIEDGSYIPNTLIAIRLARVLGSSVEKLFPLEQETGAVSVAQAELLTDSSVPFQKDQLVQVCPKNGKLLAMPIQPQSSFLPHADGIIQRRSGTSVTVRMIRAVSETERTVVLAGCDPALSILREHVEAAGVRVAMTSCSSRRALELLKQGKVDVAGSHLLGRDTEEYNLPIIRTMFEPASINVVHFAAWQQGILSRNGARKRPRSLVDLSAGEFHIVNREPGSGSRSLLDDTLQRAGITGARVPGYRHIAAGHLAAAFAVASGAVDCCIATSSAARCYGLRFLPLRQERFDLTFRRTFADSNAGRILLDVLNRGSLRRELLGVAGYDTADTGRELL